MSSIPTTYKRITNVARKSENIRALLQSDPFAIVARVNVADSLVTKSAVATDWSGAEKLQRSMLRACNPQESVMTLIRFNGAYLQHHHAAESLRFSPESAPESDAPAESTPVERAPRRMRSSTPATERTLRATPSAPRSTTAKRSASDNAQRSAGANAPESAPRQNRKSATTPENVVTRQRTSVENEKTIMMIRKYAKILGLSDAKIRARFGKSALDSATNVYALRDVRRALADEAKSLRK